MKELEKWPLVFGNKVNLNYNGMIIEIIYHGIVSGSHIFSIDSVEIFIPIEFSSVPVLTAAGILKFTITAPINGTLPANPTFSIMN